MIVKMKLSKKSLSDPRCQPLLDQNGWRDELLWGEDDAGKWFEIGLGLSSDGDKLAARQAVEPFLSVGIEPLEVVTEIVPMSVRISQAARMESRTNVDRANELYGMVDEMVGVERDAGVGQGVERVDWKAWRGPGAQGAAGAATTPSTPVATPPAAA